MDMTGSRLTLLASLSVLLDERNVTRAAARLGLSQPALSAQLARLRDMFADPLLAPAVSGKGMVLSPLAAALKDPLRDALQQVQRVVSAPVAFDPQAADRVFSIGANDNATAVIGVRLLPRIQPDARARIRLALRGLDLARLTTQLETGELDVALLAENLVPAAMSRMVLSADNYRMAQRKGHPRGMRPPTLKDYTRLQHILLSGEGGGFHGFVDDALRTKGLTRHVAVSVQYYGIVPLLLQGSDHVATLPARFLQRYAAELDSFPLPFETRGFRLHATWHPRFDTDAAHVWLRDQLAACAKD